jgi:hypothetical protein
VGPLLGPPPSAFRGSSLGPPPKAAPANRIWSVGAWGGPVFAVVPAGPSRGGYPPGLEPRPELDEPWPACAVTARYPS